VLESRVRHLTLSRCCVRLMC